MTAGRVGSTVTDMTITKKLITALALTALPLAGMMASPDPASAMIPGDPGVSGCWEWDATNGCTSYANCYVRAGFCIVTENFHGWIFEHIVTW